MKSLFNVLLTLLILTSYACKEQVANQISGTIPDAAGETIYIDRLSFDRSTNTVAQTQLDDNGQFSIKLNEVLESGSYRARIKNKSVAFVSDGKDMALNIEGDLTQIGNYEAKITGNAMTSQLSSKMQAFSKKEISLSDLTKFITDEADPLLGIQMALMVFGGNDKFLNVYKAVQKKCLSTYPNLAITKEYDKYVNQMEGTYNRKQAAEKIKVGMDAPDIVLKDPNGKIRKLSDLKGKVVLLDFWASWCGPCRRANPEVVNIYNKYKSKGFDVFSVSLDGVDDRVKARLKDPAKIQSQIESSKKRWVAAIKKDNLTWKNHVSDLKKWGSMASALYGVRSIPKTFLIGRDGKIISTNTRGSLESQLKKAL